MAWVARSKKFVVRLNKSFQTADHKLSKIIPDAVFVQQIPEENDSEGDEFNIDTNLWFSGQVYYGFKNMIMQGSSASHRVAEMGKIIETEKINTIRLYAITDGSGDRQVNFLSVQTSPVGLFLHLNFEKVLICRTATGLSYRNPVEPVHAIANLGLQSVGTMYQKMPPDMEK